MERWEEARINKKKKSEENNLKMSFFTLNFALQMRSESNYKQSKNTAAFQFYENK